MLASLRSAAVFGVDAYPVLVEVDVAFGLPHFTMVGLPDATVRESRDRVRSAIRNSGFEFPHHRITVNLAPADVRKAGSSFDLPIALGLLAASGPLARHTIADTVVLGELSLDGGINAIRGVLPIAVAARRLGVKRLLLPPQNAAEACAVTGLEVCTVRALPDAVAALNDPDSAVLAGPIQETTFVPTTDVEGDLADVRGQLPVALAGAGILIILTTEKTVLSHFFFTGIFVRSTSTDKKNLRYLSISVLSISLPCSSIHLFSSPPSINSAP